MDVEMSGALRGGLQGSSLPTDPQLPDTLKLGQLLDGFKPHTRDGRPILKAPSRARKGGEQGVNGAHYEGGQLLPSSKATEQGKQKSAKKVSTGKQEIAPYVWEAPPAPGARALWRGLGVGQWTTIDRVTGQVVLNPSLNWDFMAAQAHTPAAELQADYQARADRYNAGERWDLPRPIAKAHREVINRSGHFRRTKAGALTWVEPHQVLAHIAEHGLEPDPPKDANQSVWMGRQAMAECFKGRNVVHAMHRKGFGWIDFEQGISDSEVQRLTRETGKDVKPYGIRHVWEKRNREHRQDPSKPDDRRPSSCCRMPSPREPCNPTMTTGQ
jgi:hypothetical protein